MTAIADRAAVLPDDPAETTTPAARQPRWPRLGLAGLLAVTAALYLWDLSANGYGNAFYAAAAQAGSQSWSAWFFGSLDPHNVVTVDKPPAALWVTGLSVRAFGMNPWAVQVPQALMGVAAVGVLYAAIRRAVPDAGQGAIAGLLGGAVLALTPVAVLMFRYNNPDALLALLITIAAYCLARAVPAASWRWLALAGMALGLAFLTKMFAGLLVLPAMGAAYLLFAPTAWWKRLGHLLTAGAALVVSAGWWVLVVQLWPADARPYISNSADNSVLGLAVGYNGMHRLVGGGRQHAGFGGGQSGLHRLFAAEMANEISWLLPVAVFAVCLGGYLWLRGRLSRGEKAALVDWAGWMTVCWGVFSYMDGMVHPYYTVAMAPAVGALVGLGGMWAWRLRSTWVGRAALAAMITLPAGWAVLLLHRNAFGPAALRWAIAVTAVTALVLLLAGSLRGRRLLPLAAAVGLVAGLGGTTVFAVATAATPHDGAIPNAVHTARVWPIVGKRINVPGGFRIGNMRADTALGALLRATSTQWSAATTGSQSASALEVSSGTAVMAIGGWNNDPVPSLADFIDDVHAGRISYYIDNSRDHGLARYGRQIAEWVAHNYQPTVVGGTKVYRLV